MSSAPSTPPSPPPASPTHQPPLRRIAEAVQLVLRSETLGSLALLHRSASLAALPLSQLLLLQSVRAAVERDAESAIPPSPAAALRLLRDALPSELLLDSSGSLLLASPPSLDAAEWPDTLAVIHLPVSGEPQELQLSLANETDALAPLAARLSASALVFSRPLGARPKPGRPRGEPRLYFDAAATACNAAASWLAGCEVVGDALLAHVALPPRRFGPTPPPAPPKLAFADVTLAALQQLADASVAPAALSEMCARLPGPPPRVEAWELPSEECPAEALHIELASPPTPLIDAALHSLAQLPTPPASLQSAGWRATATPPPALSGVSARQAAGPTRAAAEHAASQLLLCNLREYGCAQLGRECAEHETTPPPAAIAPRLFSPPLADQRRMFVAALLRTAAATSLLDAGCGRGALLLSLAQEQHGTSPMMEYVAGVDTSESGLAEAKKVLAPCAPPHLSLWAGSLHEAATAWGERSFDAVTCIEVIEHQPDEESAARAGASLLSVARRLAVFTTPNAEANVQMEAASAGVRHLPAGAVSSGAFRDSDHKFEWSRAQLRDWALTAAAASGGEWEITLLTLGAMRAAVQPAGGPPAGCSQAAVFWRTDAGASPVAGPRLGVNDVREGTSLRLFADMRSGDGQVSWTNARQVKHSYK